ncbi:MAG: hypothetical protein WA965_13945, partial [Mycobacterium sp.]
MGRHSLPDPEDAGRPGPAEEQPDEQQTERFGFGAGAASDEPGFDDEVGPPDRRDPDTYEADTYDEDAHDADIYDDDFGYSDRADEFGYPDREGATAARSGPPPPTGPQHGGDWEGGEWTGSHRAVTPGRRGISIG